MVQLLKISTIALMLILIFPIVYSQDASLEMKFVGYGDSYQELHVSFKNTGERIISDVTIYIDGEAYKTIEGISSPGIKFIEVFFLEPGKHTIEARTPEGAYDSIEVTASEGEFPKTTTTLPGKPDVFDLTKENILLVAGCLIIVLSVILWLVTRKKHTRKK